MALLHNGRASLPTIDLIVGDKRAVDNIGRSRPTTAAVSITAQAYRSTAPYGSPSGRGAVGAHHDGHRPEHPFVA
jgi:hypothetical protein